MWSEQSGNLDCNGTGGDGCHTSSAGRGGGGGGSELFLVDGARRRRDCGRSEPGQLQTGHSHAVARRRGRRRTARTARHPRRFEENVRRRRR